MERRSRPVEAVDVIGQTEWPTTMIRDEEIEDAVSA
jgi:hypothetical protein